jgi:hypothetical protein
MTEPKNLDGWMQRFRDRIEEARISNLTGAEREALVASIRKDANIILDGMDVPSAWADIGYRAR